MIIQNKYRTDLADVKARLLYYYFQWQVVPSDLFQIFTLFTFVSEDCSNLYFCKTLTIAILVSSMANLAPMQLRGPAPNGMKENGFIFSLFVEENLKNIQKEYCYRSFN